MAIQQAQETDYQKPAPENGWEGASDYKLLPEIPATSSAIAELRAEGVEMFAKHCDDSIGFDDDAFYTLMGEHVRKFARQLRESKGEVQS